MAQWLLTLLDAMPFRFVIRSFVAIDPAALGERKTLFISASIYAAWGLTTYFHRWIPWPILFVLGGWLLAWQGSIQHETIHGHPTRSKGLNTWIGRPPLSLWLPYERYRETHLSHHASKELTEPTGDPESRYLQRRAGPGAAVQAWLMELNSTLLGRLVLGPLIEISTFLAREALALAQGDRRRWSIWSVHVLEVALIAIWLKVECRMNLRLYFIAFIYPAAALSLLRSFAEHRAADQPGHRIAIVENTPIFGLLFLNNNLHAVHHAYPAAPWDQLPVLYRRHRSKILAANGGLVYNGYQEIFRRFLLAPHDHIFHPGPSKPLAADR